jgi:hypothetical protein
VRRTVLAAFVSCACSARTPPPGSGSLETTPTGGALVPHEPVSVARVITYPNGSVLTVDPADCRIRLLRDGKVRWEHSSSACAGFLEANVAMDSTLYVREPKELSSFDADGALKWAKAITEPIPPQSLALPAVLPDSRMAFATSSRNVSVLDRDGSVSWTFALPSGEDLVAPPIGMKTEGLVLVTSRAVYYLGASGEVRWRNVGPEHKEP